MAKTPIYEEIKCILIARGWAIDPNAKEDRSGATREFIHPENGTRYAWIDAILQEGSREE